MLGAGAGAAELVAVLPEFDADVLEGALDALAVELVLEPELLPATAVLAENGLAPPEPQPTTEVMAKAATLNFMKTLEVKPT